MIWVSIVGMPNMLRWITALLGTCLVSGAAGLGFVGPMDGHVRNWCLALTALSATLLISSFDAYETQAHTRSSDREDE